MGINESRNHSEISAKSGNKKRGPDHLLLRTIPGVGNYAALTAASMIVDINRFNSPESLCSYAGVVPSVRGSANVVHHGRITKNGDKLLRWVLTSASSRTSAMRLNTHTLKQVTYASQRRGATARPQ